MRIVLVYIFSPIVALILWASLVYTGTINGNTHQPIAKGGSSGAFFSAAANTIDSVSKGNAAFILLENGAIVGEHYVSKGRPVDANTLFQVASLSKWVSAWGVMSLVEEGKLALDTPVSTYLTRWQLPESEFDNSQVTVRRLLSHTAGLTDGLGYAGYGSPAEVQALEASLTQAADASPGADGRVRVGLQPGTEFKYSGGGYTLLQLLIEEVTDGTFEAHMQQTIFRPLGMNRSTFVNVDENTRNVATFYDADGSEGPHYRFTALAPTSLYTTAADMSLFIQAHFDSVDGLPAGRGVLTANTIKLMQQPHASKMGMDIWGLGTMLFAPTNDGGFIIGHDGKNDPAINTAARLNPVTGDGIVILETGNDLLASRLAGEWTYLQTGKLDLVLFSLATDVMIKIILLGWLFIILITCVFAWRAWRRRKMPQVSA